MASSGGLRLASFDGGGPRSFSQLIIMKRFMNQLRWAIYPDDPSKIMLPCDYFEMIGGSDMGGLIAIMFAKLRMSVEEAIEEFGLIVDAVYAKGLQPEERTARLRNCMECLLIKRDLPVDLKLEGRRRDNRCAGFVIAASRLNVYDKVCLRTYLVPSDPATAITVVDAVLATCASPSLFLPVFSGTIYERCEYVGAGIGANNPLRQVIIEAYLHFDSRSTVALILSLGSGHPGVFALERDKDDSGLYNLMLEMITESEQEALTMERQMGHSPIYFRFSVDQGLQKSDPRVNGIQWISGQTNAYSKLPETEDRLKDSAKKACSRRGMVLLKTLDHIGWLTPPSATYMTIDAASEADGSRFQEVEAHHEAQPNGATKLDIYEAIEPPTITSSIHHRDKESDSLQRDALLCDRGQAENDKPATIDPIEALTSTKYQHSALSSNQRDVDMGETSPRGERERPNPVAMVNPAGCTSLAHRSPGGSGATSEGTTTPKPRKRDRLSHSVKGFRNQPQGPAIGKLLDHAVHVGVLCGSSVNTVSRVREKPTIAPTIIRSGVMTSLGVGSYTS